MDGDQYDHRQNAPEEGAPPGFARLAAGAPHEEPG